MSTSSRSKSNSSPETVAVSAIASQESGRTELRLDQGSVTSTPLTPLSLPPPPLSVTGDSNNEARAAAAAAEEKSPKKQKILRRRFRKRRSDSPLNSSKESRASSMTGRTVKFHRLFDIPTSEVLIRTFPCALKAEILLQGTFYVSANYFCFYARLANKRKTIKIPITTVIEITREKTAIFFPNAIGIRTDTCRYVFGSILSRENTLKLLLDLWKAALSSTANGIAQPKEQAIETVRRIFRSSSDSDLASLQSGEAAVLVKQRGSNHQNGDCRPLSSNPSQQQLPTAASSTGGSSESSSSHQHRQTRPPLEPSSSTAAALQQSASHSWTHFILQFVIFLKSHLSFIISDNRMTLGCSLIVFCLVYVLYLAYQIHLIQQTISERLEELLQSSAVLSPLVHHR